MIRFSELDYSEQAILTRKVFTQTAAVRILGDRWGKDLSKLAKKIKIRADWEFIVWVHVPGHRPIFVSKSEFIYHFSDFRRNGAIALNLRLDYSKPKNAWVENIQQFKTTIHKLSLNSDGVTCECEDFANQNSELVSAMNRYIPGWKPTCKHIYKLLDRVGLRSQDDWIENQRWADRWTPQPDSWEEWETA